MTIAVLHYPTQEVFMIAVDEKLIDEVYNHDIEDYLVRHCVFDLDDIEYMVGDEIVINTCCHETIV